MLHLVVGQMVQCHPDQFRVCEIIGGYIQKYFKGNFKAPVANFESPGTFSEMRIHQKCIFIGNAY